MFCYTPKEEADRSKERLSEIVHMDCGEPMVPQRVQIDFNPLEGVDDNEFLIKKCADFWKLVEGSEILQSLKVFPQNVRRDTKKFVSAKDDHSISSSDISVKMSAVKVMETKGRVLGDCFMNKMKMKMTHCDADSGDYFLESPQTIATTKWSTPRKRLSVRAQREEASKLCSELEQWDTEHSKSMQPPDHGAPFTNMVRRTQ